jgi:pyridoxamine 5'-phosphate oxidase
MSQEERIVPSLESARKCYRQIVGALEQAVRTGGDPLRFFTLATSGIDGFPEARTIVLRGFDPVDRYFEFHCDRRSPKVEQIRREPRVSLVFHDHQAHWQLRVPADATVHHRDEVCERAWRDSPPTTRGNYACSVASGSEVPDGFVWVPPADLPVDSPEAFANFVVVRCRFEMLDLYTLKPTAHERGIFRWGENGAYLTRVAT